MTPDPLSDLLRPIEALSDVVTCVAPRPPHEGATMQLWHLVHADTDEEHLFCSGLVEAEARALADYVNAYPQIRDQIAQLAAENAHLRAAEDMLVAFWLLHPDEMSEETIRAAFQASPTIPEAR